MTIRGRVIDNATGNPLSGASVTLVSQDGRYLGAGVSAGLSGSFELTYPTTPDVYVMVSFVGFESVMIASEILTGEAYTTIMLVPGDTGLPPVVVTPGNKMNLGWLLLVVAVGTGIIIANRKKTDHATSR